MPYRWSRTVGQRLRKPVTFIGRDRSSIKPSDMIGLPSETTASYRHKPSRASLSLGGMIGMNPACKTGLCMVCMRGQLL